MDPNQRGLSTEAVHGARTALSGPLASAIHPSSTYRYRTLDELAAANAGTVHADTFYLRYGHPNLTAVEERVAALEGAERALVLSSGMAAISAVSFTFLSPGTRLVALREIYGGTFAFFRDVLARWGVEVIFVGLDDRDSFERECQRGAALVYVETPTNPRCRIVDLAAAKRIAANCGALLVCDATFASPVNQSTLARGADLVVQSATKYLGGHSDLLCGTVAGARSLVDRVEVFRRRTGSVPDPEQSWRLERSLKTVALRVARQSESALVLARFLTAQPEVLQVHYPGLASHPDHALAREQMRAFGGMLSFEFRGGEAAARRFAESLGLVGIAASLGGIESTVCPPAQTSHAALSRGEREKLGISAGLLRLSVGIEDPEDLIADLERGFAALRSDPR